MRQRFNRLAGELGWVLLGTLVVLTTVPSEVLAQSVPNRTLSTQTQSHAVGSPRVTAAAPIDGGRSRSVSEAASVASSASESAAAGREPPPPSSQDIALHAGHIEIEGPFNRLSLSKGVELTVSRYRVTAQRLTLERTPQGILVDGGGRVSFCPCETSVFNVGFSRATVAPPTDLLLKQATFRTCGVPVFWLPIYWVRSPNKVGLFTPRFGWRAQDGPWIGSGAHVPLSPKADFSDGALDIFAGGYLFGGVDLGVQLRTPRTLSLARWDYRDGSMIELDMQGYRHFGRSVAVSWQLEALRGLRGRIGPVSFENATRSFDRARVEAAYTDGRVLYSVGFHADVPRATQLDQFGQWGPTARWGIGAAIGDVGRVDSNMVVMGRMRQSDDARVLSMHSADLGFDFRPGPFAIRWVSRERWLVGSGGAQSYDAGLLGSELRAGLPLVARFGERHRGAEHWLEPFVHALAAYRGHGRAYAAPTSGPIGSAQIGLMNRLASGTVGSNATLELRAGVITEHAATATAVAGRWLASGVWFGLGGDVGWEGGRSWVSTLRSRLGRIDRIALRTRLEGRGTSRGERIRWLLDEAWSPWNLAWFAREGWLAGGDVDLALGRQLALSSGVRYDLLAGRVLANGIGAAYRHPCGCFAASTRVDWRVGRNGLDWLLLLDLMP